MSQASWHGTLKYSAATFQSARPADTPADAERYPRARASRYRRPRFHFAREDLVPPDARRPVRVECQPAMTPALPFVAALRKHCGTTTAFGGMVDCALYDCSEGLSSSK
jgi:hypothetical protein